jgi:hypothetical protein
MLQPDPSETERPSAGRRELTNSNAPVLTKVLLAAAFLCAVLAMIPPARPFGGVMLLLLIPVAVVTRFLVRRHDGGSCLRSTIAAALSVVALIVAVVLDPTPTPSPSSSSSPTSAPSASAPSVAAPPPPPSGPIQDLTLTGDVNGRIIVGLNPQDATDSNPNPDFAQDANGNFHAPAPSATQCASFDSGYGVANDFVGVVIAHLGRSDYAFEVEFYEARPAYQHPGTPLQPGNTNDGGSVRLARIGTDDAWQQVVGPNGEEPATITINAGHTGGTVDAWMASTQYSQKLTPSTLHISGTWRCG